MFNKRGLVSKTIACIILSVLLVVFSLRLISLVNAATGVDDGFAIGAGYAYSGGLSDFNFYFFNNGFSSSNGHPEQIVLTASSNHLAFQISIYIYSSSNVLLDDEVWNIAVSPPTLIFHHQYSVSGIVNSWHTIELKIYSSSGNFYMGFYLDGNRYDSVLAGSSTFCTEMVPSVVIESADTVQVTGMVNLSMDIFAQELLIFMINSMVELAIYVGENVQAPNNVGTSGFNLGITDSTYVLWVGNAQGYFFITDSIILSEYSTFQANAWRVRIC